MMERTFAVQTHGLTKRYGKTVAVAGIDLQVPEGAFYLLIGPNGAGKTTTFRMLLGILSPDAGHAEICGVRATPAAAARACIGFVPELHEMPYGWMRNEDLIAHHAGYHATWDADYARRLSSALEVRPRAKFGTLSKGQARRVQLLLALAHRPQVLLLDEPTDGLDPVARDTVQALIAEHIAETPTTVLAATHLVYEMERFADHVGVIRDGHLVRQVDREQLHARLRRYVLDVPDDWRPDITPELVVLKQNGTPRERRWTVWGDEAEVTGMLTAAGASVRSVASLSLDEAALALLSGKEPS